MTMKTPEQIATERLAEIGYAEWYRPYLEQVREDIAAAIEADRAQRPPVKLGAREEIHNLRFTGYTDTEIVEYLASTNPGLVYKEED